MICFPPIIKALVCLTITIAKSLIAIRIPIQAFSLCLRPATLARMVLAVSALQRSPRILSPWERIKFGLMISIRYSQKRL